MLTATEMHERWKRNVRQQNKSAEAIKGHWNSAEEKFNTFLFIIVFDLLPFNPEQLSLTDLRALAKINISTREIKAKELSGSRERLKHRGRNTLLARERRKDAVV